MPAKSNKFTKYCLIQWISMLPGRFEINRGQQWISRRYHYITSLSNLLYFGDSVYIYIYIYMYYIYGNGYIVETAQYLISNYKSLLVIINIANFQTMQKTYTLIKYYNVRNWVRYASFCDWRCTNACKNCAIKYWSNGSWLYKNYLADDDNPFKVCFKEETH